MKYLKQVLLPMLCYAASFLTTEASDRVDDIVYQMTDEQKIDFIGGYNSFYIRAYPELGIPEIHMSDGPCGVRENGKAMAYPANIALASTWDKEISYIVGRSIAMEARSKNIHMMLGPGMNVYRMPVCGRNFEYLGEDPYLAGQLAVNYVRGVQAEGVIACAKHFVANNQEFERNHCSSDMDERTLHEIYLPAFKASVEQGDVATVMTSYNLINGVHASQNAYLIQDILKGDWGFEGFVVSDWVSTYDGLACAQNGLDVEMPSGEKMNRESLLPALRNGQLSQSALNDKIRRILNVYERFGFFDYPDISKGFHLDTKHIEDTALKAAREGTVLLKNKGILPLKKEKLSKIAIIGPNGDPAVTGGGGSSLVEASNAVSLLQAVKDLVGENVEVDYHAGVFTHVFLPKKIFLENHFYTYENGMRESGVQAEYFDNIILSGKSVAKAHYDLLNLVDDAIGNISGVPAKNFSVRFTCYFQPDVSGVYTFGVAGDDGYRLFIDGEMKVEEWRKQSERTAKYQIDLKAGKEHKIVLEYYQGDGGASVRLGVSKTPKEISAEAYLNEAIAIAKDADAVILSVGFDPETEGEGFDRTFELPYNQNELIKAVSEVNPNSIVVLNSGGNVDMNSWVAGTNALLEAWYPGTLGNVAVAEILFGDTNPSGKLPVSFEKNLQDNPCYKSYFDKDNDLRVFYKEGIFMGYRYWDQSNVKPRFPFGYGLSYTSFAYDQLKTDKLTYSQDEPIIVSAEITNKGDFDGAEIAQLYVGDIDSSIPRPLKELKGFQRILMSKGESKKVSFVLHKNDLSFYNPKTHKWEFEPGQFKLYLGASSADIRATVIITVQ